MSVIRDDRYGTGQDGFKVPVTPRLVSSRRESKARAREHPPVGEVAASACTARPIAISPLTPTRLNSTKKQHRQIRERVRGCADFQAFSEASRRVKKLLEAETEDAVIAKECMVSAFREAGPSPRSSLAESPASVRATQASQSEPPTPAPLEPFSMTRFNAYRYTGRPRRLPPLERTPRANTQSCGALCSARLQPAKSRSPHPRSAANSAARSKCLSALRLAALAAPALCAAAV